MRRNTKLGNIKWGFHCLVLFLYPQLTFMRMKHSTSIRGEGAPSYFGNIIDTALDVHFPAWEIGRRRPIPLPLRSPDLSSKDLFMSCVKDIYSKNLIVLQAYNG